MRLSLSLHPQLSNIAHRLLDCAHNAHRLTVLDEQKIDFAAAAKLLNGPQEQAFAGADTCHASAAQILGATSCTLFMNRSIHSLSTRRTPRKASLCDLAQIDLIRPLATNS